VGIDQLGNACDIPPYSFAPIPQSSDALRLSSREGANPPQLVVTYGGG